MGLLALRDVLLLLPRRPVTADVAAAGPGWGSSLEGCRLEEAVDGSDLVVTRWARRSGAQTVVVLGRGSGRRLRSAGYAVQRYRVECQGVDAQLLVPSGSPRPRAALPVRRHQVLRRFRQALRQVANHEPRSLLVADRGPTAAPAVLTAATGAARPAPLLLGADPRRRGAFFVPRAGGAGAAVVKVVRDLGDDERAAHEQSTLERLHRSGLGANVPEPLGWGVTNGLAWTSESAVVGVGLDVRLGEISPPEAKELLAAVATWLTAVAAATRVERRWGESAGDDVVPLRGAAVQLLPLLHELHDVPAVLMHGDLASGGNVLVEGSSFSVIDWETARPDGLPLLDLVPLLGMGLARAHGCRGPEDTAAVILQLSRGHHADSSWLFDVIAEYCKSVGVPLTAVGRLASLAWGYQASLRLVHEELVVAAGREPVQWRSAAEFVLAALDGDPVLGTAWAPFLAHVGGVA